MALTHKGMPDSEMVGELAEVSRLKIIVGDVIYINTVFKGT